MARSKEANTSPAAPPERRGRGRPRKPDALSGAQRQAAYRTREMAKGISVTVTKKTEVDATIHAAVVKERDKLLQEVARLRDATSQRTSPTSKTGFEIIERALNAAVPQDALGLDDKRLSTMLNGAQGFALSRLMRHYLLTQRIVLERLIYWADEAVIASFSDDALINRYLTRSNKK